MCTIQPAFSAVQAFKDLTAAFAARPSACLRTAIELVEGRDYIVPSGQEGQLVQWEWLVGPGQQMWALTAGMDRWIDFRISPEGECKFAIAVHAKHDEKILCGRGRANSIDRDSAWRVARLRRTTALGSQPLLLVIVHFGDAADDASYRTELIKHAARVGITVKTIQLEALPSVEKVRSVIKLLNDDPSVHSVLVQTIRNKEIADVIRETLSSEKDPEHINAVHMGQLMYSDGHTPVGAPSTAVAIRMLIHDALGTNLSGIDVSVLNSSPVVGRPLTELLENDGATVTRCHRDTGSHNMIAHLMHADVIVTATGRRNLVEARFIKPGAVVIDVVVMREGDKLVGDIVADQAMPIVSKITPVPGGVGPVTSAVLCRAVVELAEAQFAR